MARVLTQPEAKHSRKVGRIRNCRGEFTYFILFNSPKLSRVFPSAYMLRESNCFLVLITVFVIVIYGTFAFPNVSEACGIVEQYSL